MKALESADHFAAFPANQDTDRGTNITLQQANYLITWASRWGLDAWAGHVYYTHGRPTISETGAIANAHLSGNFGGLVTTHIHEEQAEALGFELPGVGWRCDVLYKDATEPMVDYGWVARSEVTAMEKKAGDRARYLPLVAHTSLLAKARAIRRALLRAFPLIDRTSTLPAPQIPPETQNTPEEDFRAEATHQLPEGLPAPQEDDPLDSMLWDHPDETQEDLPPDSEEEPDQDLPTDHWCHSHNQAYTLKQRANAHWYSYKTTGGAWCNEPKDQ